MKTVKKFLFIIAGICLLIACSKSDLFRGEGSLGNTMKNGKSEPAMVTIPFKAVFILGTTEEIRIIIHVNGTIPGKLPAERDDSKERQDQE
jgi:hypothetical protein